jgi:hypothetical protein
MLWPLPHASLVYEFQLVSDPESVVASSTVGNAGAGNPPGNAAIARSNELEIQLPRLELNLIQLSSVADAEWNSLLAGEGLHMDVTQTVHLQTSIANKDPRVSFYRSLANVKQWFVTTVMEPFVSSAVAANDNIYLTQWSKAFLKECCFLFPGREYILKKTSPGRRGAIDANGVPTTTAAPTLAQRITLDKALADNPHDLPAHLGIEEVPRARDQARGARDAREARAGDD